MKIDNITQYFTRRKIDLSILVGHCVKGNYLIVPREFFGSDSIILNQDEYEFQLFNVLERHIEKNVITKEMIEKYYVDKSKHLIKHHSNGNAIVKLHNITLKIYVDTLNDAALEEYEYVVEYIKLRQKFHDFKMEYAWAKSLDIEKHSYHNLNIDMKKYEYEKLRDAYIQARITAKEKCQTKERFDVMVRIYWSTLNQ